MAASGAGQASAGPLLLLDGMSLAFRAFHALPEELATSSGVVTNAVHGVASMVLNLCRDHRPSGVAVAFDLPGPTFRDEIFDDYKGGRAETPENLPHQFELIRGLLESLGIPVVSAEGYEADDVLATLATEARDRGQDVIVVTGDRDAFQLVEDPHVRVLYNQRGVSQYALYDEAGIEERTGVRPEHYPLLASLRGDKSDNLEGVPGVGEKTAAKLVNEYGNLEGIYAHLDALSPKLRDNLAASEARVLRNAEVIPLVRDVQLDVHVDQLDLGGWHRDVVAQTFASLEMANAWNRFASAMDDGLFGIPAGGNVGLDGGASGGGEGLGGATPGAGVPDWLEDPTWIVPATAKDAAAALETVATRARSGTGVVAVAARWAGDPGRSTLEALAIADEPGADATSTTVLLAGGSAGVLSDAAVLTGLASLVGDGGVGVVAHDAKELMRTLLPLGIDVVGLTVDTAVAAYLLDPSVDTYRLADLAARFLGVELSDGTAAAGQGSFDLSESDEAEGASDLSSGDMVLIGHARCLARLRAPMHEALSAIDEAGLYEDVERPLVRVLARMEVTGVPVDRSVLESLASELAGACDRLRTELHELAGRPFNVNSVKDLQVVLYEDLGLTPIRKTKTGYSTDARTLEQLRGEHPIIETLLRYREVEKLRSTYGTSLIAEIAPDGRIHATFRQTVARTGRLSSDRPNLHNIPVRTDEGRRFREAFVPSAGRRLLVADYDQVELRAIAHLSGDPGMLAAFASGEDIHRTVAGRVFGVAPEDVSHEQRSTAKMISYGLAYGMEAFGLAQRLNVPVDEAQGILAAFFDGFPSVRSYMDHAVAQAHAQGYTVTAFGRRRPLPDLESPVFQVRQAAERQAMNAGIQGLAADLFKMALLRLDEQLALGGYRSDLVLQVHDEVILDVDPEEEDAMAELTQSALTGAVELQVPLVVSMAWGSSWAEAKGA